MNLLNFSKIFFIFLIQIFFINQGFGQIDRSSEKISDKQLFIEKRCVRCHTIGRGRFVGPDLSGIKNRYTYEEIVEWIRNPKIIYDKRNKMPINDTYPPMPNLNVEVDEAKKIADYLVNFNIEPTVEKGGSVFGTVENISTDSVQAEQEIILRTFLGERLTDTYIVKSDQNGKFKFRDIPWVNSFEISINYQNNEYVTDKMVFNPEEDSKQLNLPIYDSTEDDADIALRLNHIILSPKESYLTVTEIYKFINRGRKIFIGKKIDESNTRKTLIFDIPDYSYDLQVFAGMDKNNTLIEGNRIFDTSGFQPGIRQVIFNYNVPLKSVSTVLKKVITYKTENMLILSENNRSGISVKGLNKTDSIVIDNVEYNRWLGKDISQESDIEIKIKKSISQLLELKYIPILIFLVFLIFGLVVKNFLKSKYRFL